MSVPEIHYIIDMLALPSQFTSNDKCQGENPQQRVQKAAVIRVFLFCFIKRCNKNPFEGTMLDRSARRQTLYLQFLKTDVLFRPFYTHFNLKHSTSGNGNLFI